MNEASASEYLFLANALMIRDPSTSENILRDGLKRFPLSSGFHLLLGRVHQTRGEDADAFYEYQWELLRTGSERPEGRDAAKCCAELLKVGHSSQELADFIAGVQQMQSNAGKAQTIFAELTRKHGERLLLNLYAAEAAQSSGDTVEAMRMYRRILQEDAGFIPAYVQLSELLRADGIDDEAERLMRRAREIDPEHWRLNPGGTP